jgi:hypothetical protein
MAITIGNLAMQKIMIKGSKTVRRWPMRLGRSKNIQSKEFNNMNAMARRT